MLQNMLKNILLCSLSIVVAALCGIAFTTPIRDKIAVPGYGKQHVRELTTSVSLLCPIPKKALNKNFYGQYFEDFILSIVFSSVAKGSYVDVGANSPTLDSVTKYFYQKGWSGINIEPIPNKYEDLVKDRPKDINLKVGISNTPGNKEFYLVYNKEDHKADALSTFDKNVLNEDIKAGFLYETLSAKMITLNEVLDSNHLPQINFLKIDVEGNEKEVLNSIDLKKYRPEVILVEATEPMTWVDSSYKWEKILLTNNYVFILFDGLNSYYVAKENYNRLYDNFLKAYNCTVASNKKYHLINNKMLFSADFTNLNA